MLSFIAEEISLRLVANRHISINKMKYYTYGIELILNDIMIFLSIAIISILSGKIIISIAYALTYCPIRSYAGGYHCETYKKCYLTTMVLYISMLFLNQFLSNYRFIVSLILIAIAFPVVLILSPVDYGNGPISNDERRKFRMKIIVLLTIAVTGFIIAVVLHETEIAFSISWGIFIVFFLMLLSVLKRKRNEVRK